MRIVAVWIECDVPDCNNQHPTHFGFNTVEPARREAALEGWVRRRIGMGYQDLCPDHIIAAAVDTEEIR